MPITKRTEAQLKRLMASLTNDEGEPIFETLEDMAEFAIDRYSASYFDATLPDGWALSDELTLTHMEVYSEAYNDPKNSREWYGRGRTIRAALAAGFILTPEGLTKEDIGKQHPRISTQVKNAIDAHMLRLMIADPNSSGPSQTT